MKSSDLYITFIFLLFASSYAKAQNASVSAQVDSTSMQIGDKFQLHLTAKVPQSARLESIDLSELEAVENVEIGAETDWDSMMAGQEIILKKDLTLQVWDSGYYWIPEIPFVLAQNGASIVYKTNRIPISVGSVILQDSIQLADIKDIIREKATWEDYLFLIVAFAMICLAVLGYYLCKKRQAAKTAPPAPEVKLPAHEIALTALTKLKGEKLWQQGDVKTYQSRLTYIIREYLENRYDIRALESTTDEILRSLKAVDFDGSWKDKLQNILQVADLVKFAKAKPPADFHDRVLKEAEDFVIATKVKPVIVEEPVTSNQVHRDSSEQPATE
ncbi:MAG: hypothetical protein AAGJ18_02135 [Bacteroidota bacterium]